VGQKQAQDPKPYAEHHEETPAYTAKRAEEGSNYFALGTVIGLAIGAAAALVFAPKSGEETRSQLAEKGSQLKDTVAERRSQLAEKGIELKDTVAVKVPSPAALGDRVKDLKTTVAEKVPSPAALGDKVKSVVPGLGGSTPSAEDEVQAAAERINQATHEDVHPHENAPGAQSTSGTRNTWQTREF